MAPTDSKSPENRSVFTAHSGRMGAVLVWGDGGKVTSNHEIRVKCSRPGYE